MKGIFESIGINACLDKMFKLGTKLLDPSIKAFATSSISALHTKMHISYQEMLQDCRAMLAKATDMTWTFELEFVDFWKNFFSTAFKILEKLGEDEKKMQAILEEFLVLPEAKDPEMMGGDWNIVTVDDVEEFEVLEGPLKSR